MAATRIAEQIRSPDQHNPLVPLALGLLSSLARLEDLIAPAAPEPETSGVREESDPVLLAALGLFSLRARLRRWLEEACPEPPAGSPAPAPPSRREWLR